jgi:hypothetical protein
MICYVVLMTSGEDTEVLYCGTEKDIAEDILYDGMRANRSMEVWEDGKYIKSEWGNLK